MKRHGNLWNQIIDEENIRQGTINACRDKGRKTNTKKKENSEYVTIHIEYEGKHRVVFTGSVVLKNQLDKYKDHLPFQTTIKKINNFYSFT